MTGLPEFTTDELVPLVEACEVMRAQIPVADLGRMLPPATHSVVLRACALVHAVPVPGQPGAVRMRTESFRITVPEREAGDTE